MNHEKHLLISFDLEEFDLPEEYGIAISPQEKIRISSQGLERLFALLKQKNIQVTYFITSAYAIENRSMISALSKENEIASHSHNHSRFVLGDYEKSKNILEEITGAAVNGFRMPRFDKTDYSEIKKCGYVYDSSINPTWMPGRYNNLSKTRTVKRDQQTGITILPISVTPYFRIPLAWFVFKNIPLNTFSRLCIRTLNHDHYLHLYFHPWEFADIQGFKIPGYIKKYDGEKLLERLSKLIDNLSGYGKFVTISEFLEEKKFGMQTGII